MNKEKPKEGEKQEKHKAWCDLFDEQDICTCGLVDSYPWNGFGPKSPDCDGNLK